MAEACAVSRDNSRRCLPAWMTKPCSSDEVSRTDRRNERALESDERSGNLDQMKPVKRKRGRQVKTVDTDDASNELGALQPCQGGKWVSRKSRDAVEDELEAIEKVAGKNARKVSGRAAPKNTRKRKLEKVESEAPSSSGRIDDEVELTVEDLVSIAEEYVNADKQKQPLAETTQTARYKENRSSPPVSTKTDTGRSLVNARPVNGLLRCTTAVRNTTSSDCRGDENNKDQEQHCTSSIKMTDDVGQDMLNIFFGPLLRKRAENANRSEAIDSLIMKAKPPPEKKDLHCNVQKHEEPAVTKKKSSLKDKVALFF